MNGKDKMTDITMLDKIKKIQEFAEMGYKQQQEICRKDIGDNVSDKTLEYECNKCAKCACYCILEQLGLK